MSAAAVLGWSAQEKDVDFRREELMRRIEVRLSMSAERAADG
jgi:hypothetical protein